VPFDLLSAAFGVMRQTRSIRVRLTLVFCFFLVLVVLLGAFSIGSLSYVNAISSDIRDRWLKSTALLGDLTNSTSDFRAAEGAMLLSSNAGEIAASEKEMMTLDQAIANAERDYEKIIHAAEENAPYAEFQANWSYYREVVKRVIALAAAGRGADAIAIYRTTSRAAYAAASDVLDRLTAQNVEDAGKASRRAERAYRDARWLIGFAIVVGGLMAAGAVTYIRRSVSDPVLDLAGRMYRLAANELDVELHGAERRDEIGEMVRAAVVFRNNAIDLAASQRALAQQASMLEEKLAEEQRLALLQRNFVSMVSHEFRTPLTIIDGQAQRLVAMKDHVDPEEVAERAAKVRRAVVRMISLIDSLLNSGRVLEGEPGLYFHPAELDLAALLHEVCQLHRQIAPGSQISETFPAPMTTVGDAKLLFQVFSNLLANAIKYSPDGGLIKISGAAEAGGVVVTVEDRGVGIPAGDVEHVFERYYRGGNVSGIVGTGIGLYFVKMVVELHGGEISVASREGQGARFTVRLPRRAA
jgi:two-component system, OmpR family, sensor kinase